jgi:hypothetical protein
MVLVDVDCTVNVLVDVGCSVNVAGVANMRCGAVRFSHSSGRGLPWERSGQATNIDAVQMRMKTFYVQSIVR